VWLESLSAFLVFVTCLACFPGLATSLTSPTLGSWFPLLMVAAYNCGANLCPGRTLPAGAQPASPRPLPTLGDLFGKTLPARARLVSRRRLPAAAHASAPHAPPHRTRPPTSSHSPAGPFRLLCPRGPRTDTGPPPWPGRGGLVAARPLHGRHSRGVGPAQRPRRRGGRLPRAGATVDATPTPPPLSSRRALRSRALSLAAPPRRRSLPAWVSAHLLFVPLFLLLLRAPAGRGGASDALPLGCTFGLGVSTGYIGCMALVLVGEHAGSAEEKELWGTASSFSLMLGLTAGSLLSFALSAAFASPS